MNRKMCVLAIIIDSDVLKQEFILMQISLNSVVAPAFQLSTYRKSFY